MSTLNINGVDYTLAPIITKQAKAIRDTAGGDGEEFTMALILASLQAGGSAQTREDLDNLPYFQGFVALQKEAYKVNGLAKPGEDLAAVPAAAESISPSSTLT